VELASFHLEWEQGSTRGGLISKPPGPSFMCVKKLNSEWAGLKTGMLDYCR